MNSRVAGEVFEILDSHRVDITRVEGLYCVCGYKLSIREELAGHHAAMLEQRGLLRPEIDDAMIELGYEAFVKSNPDLGEDVGLVDIEAALEAALGGERS